MANNGNKRSFLSGAAILAGAVAAVKLIGAVYKLPLNNFLGDTGKAYFSVAYSIYNVLLTVSTAGLPLAISKLTSQAHALGRENQKRKIFSVSIWLFFALGVTGSLLMFFQAEQLAALMRNTGAYLAIRALSPAVFCVCLLACMRGYTQGQGNMTPTAVSQILEALCKLGVGLSLAWYLLVSRQDMQTVSAGAILGVTVGTVVSMLFMIAYLLRHRSRAPGSDTPDSSGSIMRQVLAIGVPITLSNSAMSIITLIDTKIVMGRLQDGLLLSENAASALYGQYSFAMDLINLPPSFVFPVTMSLIPFAATALAQRDNARANRIVASAFRLIALLALPAGVGLSVLATPILVTIYPAQRDVAMAAGPHLQVLGFACIFICIMTLTNAVLQAYGKEKIPIFTVIAGGVTKMVMNYVLVGDPDIGINGAPISTLCCYGVIVALNLFFVWKHSPEKPRYLSLFAKPALASALMGVCAWAVQGLAFRVLSAGHSDYGATAVSTILGIGGGVLAYFVLVIALRILRAEDVRAIPHGEKLIRLLHLR